MLIRRLMQGVLGLGATALLWGSRIIQVATFAAAAAVRGQYRAHMPGGPASRSAEWSTVPRPTAKIASLNPLILVTYHPEYHAFDPQFAYASLLSATQLGVGWIRIDIRWREILPDGEHRDPLAIDWYRAFLSAASECGLKVMVVLSSPHEAVLRQGRSQRLESWNRFIEVVAAEFGGRCEIYQLMNELNNPIYSIFPLRDTARAIISGAAIIRSLEPEAKIAINVAMEFWGWHRYLTDVLQLSGLSVDIVGLDHYPGTWTIGWRSRWTEVMQLAGMIQSTSSESPWFKRHLAIMETGFSTNMAMRNQKSQAEYFENVVGITRDLKRNSWGNGPVLGIYELCDGDSSAWLDPEAHFGLLTTNLRPKKAFSIVRRIVASL
jgi:hypothetical protein